MATITGKRFQITDGASTPTNLFPYTVSEAVYGLSNTISNAISTALSALSLSTYAGTSAIGSSTQPVYYNGSALVATNLSTTYAPYNANGYLPLNGGTLTRDDAPLDLKGGANSSRLAFYTSDNTWRGYVMYGWGCLYLTAPRSGGVNGQLGISNAMTDPYWSPDNGTTNYNLWHSGNANLSTVPWACSTLTASDNIYMANNKYLYRYDSGGVARSILDYESNGTMLFCWGNATGGYSTSICGNTVSLRYGTSHTIGMTMDTSGNVGIGTTSPTDKLHVVGFVRVMYGTSGVQFGRGGNTVDGVTASGWANMHLNYYSTGHITMCYGGGSVMIGSAGTPSQKLHVVGNILATGAITAGAASDARLKTNIRTLSAESAKRIVMALNPVTFTWNEKATELYNQYKGDDLGMIAQEVEPYLPQAVGTIFENYKRLDYTKVISPLVKVAQDHESRIRQLEAENRELRKRLNMN